MADIEQVPLLEEGGIAAFLHGEVLPHEPDALYVPNSADFYKPQPLRTLEEIRAGILALENETKGLLAEIIGEGSK